MLSNRRIRQDALKHLLYPVIAGVVLFLLLKFFAATTSVSGTLTYSENVLPEQIRDEVRKLPFAIREHQQQHLVDALTATNELEIALASVTDADRATLKSKANFIREALRKESWHQLVKEPADYTWLASVVGRDGPAMPASYYKGTVKNDGDLIASGVRLEAEGAKFALTKRGSSTPALSPVDGVVDLGNLQPGESVDLTVWSGAARFFPSNHLVIRHDGGVGDLELHVARPPFWNVLLRSLTILLWILCTAVGIVAVIACVEYLSAFLSPSKATAAMNVDEGEPTSVDKDI